MFTRIFNTVEDCTYHSWNDTHHFDIWNTWSHHCMWFTTTCLTVRKDCSIKPFNHWIYNWSCGIIIYFLLGWLCVKYSIKIKLVCAWSWNGSITHVQLNIPFIWIKIQTTCSTPCYFWFIKRSDSAHHNNISSTHF